jgi:outer membrane lipoprotein-sorting protein
MVSIAFVVVAAARGAFAGQLPSGASLLSKCQAAYDRVQTLDETVNSAAGSNVATAHIQFKRPGMLKVSGKTLFGSDYVLLCNGKSTSVLNSGFWSDVASPEMGIATITGISGMAGTTVPAALFHTNWGGIQGMAEPVQVKKELVGGRSTYRLSSASPTKQSLWIDAKSYFIVKSTTFVMEQTLTVSFAPPVLNRPISPSLFKK